MFCCYNTSAASDISVRLCVSVAGRVAGHATSWLRQRNICWASHVSAPSTSVGAQRRRQTDSSIFLVWARHTDAARPSLAAVYGMHRLQAGCARLPMPARSGATVSFRPHPACRWFQPPPSPAVVIHAASDPTYSVVHCQWLCVSGGRMPPLKQSAIWRHVSSNAHCFLESPQNPSFFPDHFLLTIFCFCSLHCGLAVLYLGHPKQF